MLSTDPTHGEMGILSNIDCDGSIEVEVWVTLIMIVTH